MINSITSSVVFVANPKRIQNSLLLSPGLTAVVGSNGSGKTLTAMEMPRYLLFGIKALRGGRADYASIDGEMSFTVKGKTYTVTRTRKAECLKDDTDTVLAINADAVNKKIIEIFGYGLEVFDVANACVQGKVQALSDMTSLERKTMVDRLTGFDKIEVIEKSCKEEAKGLVREVEALLTILPDLPVKPDLPLNYRASQVRDSQLVDLRQQASRRDRLLATVAALGAEPTMPDVERPDAAELERLDLHENSRSFVLFEVGSLERQLAAIPDAQFTIDELDAAEAWSSYVAERSRRGPKPAYSLGELEALEASWTEHLSWRAIEPCSKCGYGTNQLPRPPGPSVSQASLRSQLLAHERWTEPLVEVAEFDLNPVAIAAARVGHARAAEREHLQDALGAVVDMEDQSMALAAAETAEQTWLVYDARLSDYTRAAGGARICQVEADQIGDLSEVCTQVSDQLLEAQVYERELLKYEADLKRHTDLQAQIDDRRARREGFESGAKALKEVRVEYKTHLAPSISLLASQLISGMTGGALDRIEVDPDFNITVAGQPIHTLSGSEAAVANLALRVGLGQVLTANVFSVFLGDEIDAAMDAERAEYTAQAFRGLSAVLKQVILVSHKNIEADQLVEL